MTTTNRPTTPHTPDAAVEGDTVEEMLSGGADVDALIESGELDGEWRSPAELEDERQANLAENADFLEWSRHYTPIEIIF